ncbi:cyclic nucleotide-binding domain-containing protein [Actinomadura rupiterrae]|uniref:cyclic nucleotide-binding domain-containing protein n=1 Tax=Actinomadura rupiterrae TaxID=559627 RepID=UPI0020A40238|nr:cyclic nucleotide-binding domain-containing protein [Actinomadura rupiterrae]MCP2335368.1 CRP-like cAMP-binding protein [Actinomadura rupiterrae]
MPGAVIVALASVFILAVGFTAAMLALVTRGLLLARDTAELRALVRDFAVFYTLPLSVLVRRLPATALNLDGGTTPGAAGAAEQQGVRNRPGADDPDRGFLGALDERERAALGALSREVRYEPGAVLLHSGHPGDEVLVLLTGWTAVTSAAGRLVALRGPGDIVGERAMFMVKERSATVTAVTEVTALVAPAGAVNAFLVDRPHLAAFLEDELYERMVAAAPASARAAEAPGWKGTRDCTVMFVDIAGFGAAARSQRDRRTIRDVTFTLVQDALDRAGAGPAACHREDRGDGALMLLPATVPVERLVSVAVPALLEGLREHARSAGPGLELRLRVALDAGRVVVDERGVFADVVIDTARLLDAPQLKGALAEPGRLLGLILSARVHAMLPDGSAFQRLDVAVKEHRLVGWTAVYGADAEQPRADRGMTHPHVRPHRARRLIRAARPSR